MTRTRLPFWSDGLDIDLYRLVPEARDAIGEDANVTLYTWSGPKTHGRLNHPTVWGEVWPACVVGTSPESITMPRGYVTGPSESVTECTFEELCRDAWLHHYSAVLDADFRLILCPERQWFNALMYSARGFFSVPDEDIRLSKLASLKAIEESRRGLHDALVMRGLRPR